MYAKCQMVSLAGAAVFKNVTKTYENSLWDYRSPENTYKRIDSKNYNSNWHGSGLY